MAKTHQAAKTYRVHFLGRFTIEVKDPKVDEYTLREWARNCLANCPHGLLKTADVTGPIKEGVKD